MTKTILSFIVIGTLLSIQWVQAGAYIPKKANESFSEKASRIGGNLKSSFTTPGLKNQTKQDHKINKATDVRNSALKDVTSAETTHKQLSDQATHDSKYSKTDAVKSQNKADAQAGVVAQAQGNLTNAQGKLNKLIQQKQNNPQVAAARKDAEDKDASDREAMRQQEANARLGINSPGQ